MTANLLRCLSAAMLILTGECATAPALSPAEMAELRQPVECADKPTCDRYWQRAQVWIARNSRYRIQTANDVLIQTFGPGGSTTDLAFSLVREPVGAAGASLISITAGCDNIFGCFPDSASAVRDLKAFIVAQ